MTDPIAALERLVELETTRDEAYSTAWISDVEAIDFAAVLARLRELEAENQRLREQLDDRDNTAWEKSE